MSLNILLLISLLCVVSVNSYIFNRVPMKSVKFNKSIYMSDTSEEVEVEKDFIAPTEANPDGSLFDMNRRVRLGRSRDQDGKSNIWSIEPSMQVMEEEEEGDLKKNLMIGGAVIATALACLPLFNLFSTLFPDPADF